MDSPTRPVTYEEIIRKIHDAYDGMSKSNQQISMFVTQNPNQVAVKSVNALSGMCEVHASSLVRFAQSLGFSGFKELQQVFQTRLVTAAPGFETRAQQLKDELTDDVGDGSRGALADLIVRDIASLENLLDDVSQELLDKAVKLLAEADTIYILGQLRSEPIVVLLRYILTMLGKKAVLLDPAGGLATHMAKLAEPNDVLLAVSFRYYASEVVDISEDAAARGVPIVAISDSTLSPLAKSASVLFPVPEHNHAFSRSLAAPICLAQALMVALALHLNAEDKINARIPVVTER